jgi:DNA-directed RNA polymerase subunit F
MPALNVIYNEIKAIPVNRLDELYQVIRSLTPTIKQQDQAPNTRQKEILSYAGAFSDMTVEHYADFTNELHNIRQTLFNRTVDL